MKVVTTVPLAHLKMKTYKHEFEAEVQDVIIVFGGLAGEAAVKLMKACKYQEIRQQTYLIII